VLWTTRPRAAGGWVLCTWGAMCLVGGSTGEEQQGGLESSAGTACRLIRLALGVCYFLHCACYGFAVCSGHCLAGG